MMGKRAAIFKPKVLAVCMGGVGSPVELLQVPQQLETSETVIVFKLLI